MNEYLAVDLLKRFKMRAAFGPTMESVQMLMQQLEIELAGGGLSLEVDEEEEEEKKKE